MISSKTHRTLALAGFLGLVVITGAYYLWHKPITPEFVLSAGRAAWQILVGGAILLLAGSIGARLLPLEHNPHLVRLFFQASLGLGLLSLLIFILGVSTGFHTWILAGVLVVGQLFLLRSGLRWLSGWKDLLDLWQRSAGPGKAIGFGTGLVLLMTLVTALAPPLKFDALVYHLALPRLYLQAGRLVYTPEIMFWGMPQGGEMLFVWASSLSGSSAGAVLGWWVGLITLVGLFGFVEGHLGLRAAWISLAALLSGFTLSTSLAWGYVDWFAMLFGLGFLIAIHSWRTTGERGWLILAGLFAGFAFGVKYTAGVLFLAGLVMVISSKKIVWNLSTRIREATVYSAAAAAPALPWLAKNWVAAGNPFYPLFFPAGAMDAVRLAQYQGGQAWGGWPDVLFLPIRATLLGIELAPGYSASIGPLLLGLGLLFLLPAPGLSQKTKEIVRSAAWIVLPVLVLWAIAGRFTGYLLQTRLYFCIFPALAVLAAGGFRNLALYRISGVRLGRVATVLVLLVFGLNVMEAGLYSIRQGAFEVVLGLKPQEGYLSDNLGWYGPAMQAVRELPEGSRALMLWETRSLYCLPGCEPDEIIDRWAHDLYKKGNPDAVLEDWMNQGFTHLLYYKAGAEFLRQAEGHTGDQFWPALDSLLAGLDSPVEFGEAYELYSLRP